MNQKKRLLSELLPIIQPIESVGVADKSLIIESLTSSSKDAQHGSLFFAVKGSKTDGRMFIGAACENGAIAIVADIKDLDRSLIAKISVPVFLVQDAKLVKALVAKYFYQGPEEIRLSLAVTGTNGKTSTCWILAQALTALGRPTAYLGTLGFKYWPTGRVHEVVEFPTNTTTPDAIEIHRLIGEAKERGAQGIVMEASSHAIDQGRIIGINWDGAAFTNLTRDHLDYHHTMEEYARVKELLFFKELIFSGKAKRFAVSNLNDEVGRRIINRLKTDLPEIQAIGFGVEDKNADLRLVSYDPSVQFTNLCFSINNKIVKFKSRLVGNYNAVNMLTAAGVLIGLGFKADEIADSLSQVLPVPGRLERVGDGPIGVFVDYAHTPDALVRAQESLRELAKGRLITVFGCGGDRDRGKRPIMAQEVARLSDYAVVTSDNPRTEDPQAIVDDVLVGMPKQGEGIEYEVIVDRREAIRYALSIARPDDVVLIAGKGHEDYQEINGVKHHFSDQEECQKCLKEWGILHQ